MSARSQSGQCVLREQMAVSDDCQGWSVAGIFEYRSMAACPRDENLTTFGSRFARCTE